MPSDTYERFRALLHELFLLDQADLDFGIYRVMRVKRDEITAFLTRDLLPQVRETLGARHADADLAAREQAVFGALTSFFRRYYRDGDVLALRRYQRDVYALPSAGEEVKLHWATADHYYVKSSEQFRDYTFRLPDGRRVQLKLVGADTEQHNNKPAPGQERRFVLCADEPLRAAADALIIRFVYQPTADPRRQDQLNQAAVQRILQSPVGAAWAAALATPAPTASDPRRTLLHKHLSAYTARHTFDYFIHKDLRRFLRRELDFFIKSEVLRLDEIEEHDAPRVAQDLGTITAIRRIAHKIIDMLAQLEDFQKKLWLKQKFVIETNYCVTLDRVPEALYAEIAANQAQREEWVRLFAIDEIQGSAIRPGYSVPLTVAFLRANPFLVLDTKFFDRHFRDRFVATLVDVDAQIDGLLIHSDNFQALNLLRARYAGTIDGIYIDPPYNTNATEIAYKNGYRDSSWLSMMHDRLLACADLLHDDGVVCVTIDDYQVHHLALLMKDVFPGYDITPTIIEHNRRGRVRNNFATTHEYALWAIKAGYDRITRLQDVSRAIRRNLRRTGTSSKRAESPSQFYGIEVDRATLEIRSVTESLELGAPIPAHPNPHTVMVWPIDRDGIERRWYYGRGRVIQEARAGTVWAKRIEGEIQIHYHQDGQEKRRKSVWTGADLDASTFGSELLNDMFGQRPFPFPKSVHAVQHCLESIAWNDRSCFLDFFAGSGTTAHAVITMNRADGGRRRYMLAEMGDYFEAVTKPRVQKAIYSPDWRGGRPVSRAGSSHLFKYIRLESYEDALNNLQVRRTRQQQTLLDEQPAPREGYLLRYRLEVETGGSASLLDLGRFAEPFGYTLEVAAGSVGATRSQPVDLVETFNYLLGLRVTHRANRDGITVVQGVMPAGERVLVLWRSLSQTPNDALDAWFAAQRYTAQQPPLDRIYVNGDTTLQRLRRPDEPWQVRLIEEEFQRLMFDVRDVDRA